MVVYCIHNSVHEALNRQIVSSVFIDSLLMVFFMLIEVYEIMKYDAMLIAMDLCSLIMGFCISHSYQNLM